jgi:hypothetical protein
MAMKGMRTGMFTKEALKLGKLMGRVTILGSIQVKFMMVSG